MSLNDSKKQFYLSAGIAPAPLNDMELEWLKANGATSNSINDCWREYLTSQGFVFTTYNDTIKLWLEAQGFNGSVKGMLNSFYTSSTSTQRAFSNEFSSEFG